MTRIISALLILLAASAHAQVIGVLSNLLATAATPAELTETVLELNSIVINAGDMHDLRVGDGVTPGGVRVWNTDALTEPPRSYPHGFAMNGNTISLNGSYTIGAEGPLWYLRCNGSNVMSVLANSGSLGTTISETYAGSNILRVVVAVEDEALDPLVEYSQSLITPAWTDCVYTVTRPTTSLVQLDIEIPEDATNGYFRITALSGFRVRFGIPLEAPSASVSGGLTLGGTTNVITDDGTNLTRNGVLIAGTGGTGSGFPATNHMNAAGYNLTNLNIAQGTTANFGTLNATTVNGTIFNGRDMTLSGNLNIASNLNYTINQQTTVYLGTNYITNINVTARWTTNNTYLYTNVVETHTAWYTNYVTYDTYINNGGYFNASNANWVAFPGLYIEGTNTAASGVWDFTDAIVLGLGAGTVTNAGYGLIMTNNVIAIDTSIVATGTPLYVYSETDPLSLKLTGGSLSGALTTTALSVSGSLQASNTTVNGTLGVSGVATLQKTFVSGTEILPYLGNPSVYASYDTNGVYTGGGIDNVSSVAGSLQRFCSSMGGSAAVYTNGPARGAGGSAFGGSVLLPNGKVMLTPFASANIGIYDPVANTYTNGPAHGAGAYAFVGSVLLPNGKVMLTPSSSANIGIYDPVANTYTNGPAHGAGGAAFRGSVLLPNGKVMLTPFASANIGIYDPVANTYTNGPARGAGAYAFTGSVLLPNGKVMLTPSSSANIGIYDPVANTYTNGPAHGAGAYAFTGSVLLPNGKVMLTPHNSANIGIYDPVANTYANGPAHGAGGSAFVGSVLLPNGKVMLTPYVSANIGIYDPVANTYTNGPAHGAGGSAFKGSVLLPNGKVMLTPYYSANIGIYDPRTGPCSEGTCLSPFLNKY